MRIRLDILLKVGLVLFLLLVITFIGVSYGQLSEKSGLKYDTYFGEEITGDYPRLIYVDNREELDKTLSSTNSDRIFNDAYMKQYKDSYILSTSAHIENYKATRYTAEVTLRFDNGSSTTTTYSEDGSYVGSVTISTVINKSVK